MISNRLYAIVLFALQAIAVVIIIATNIWIACIVRVQIKEVYRTRKGLGNRKDLIEHDRNIKKHIRKQKNKKQLVLARVFGAILTANFIAWLPIVVLLAVLAVADSDAIPLGYYSISALFFLMHSMLHPLIEGCFIPEVKSTFKTILGVSLCKKLIKRLNTNHGIDAKANFEIEDPEETSCGRICCDACSVAVLFDSFNSSS